MNLDLSVVADQSKLAEFVHESADAGSGGADHLRQCFLTEVGTDRLRVAFPAEIREQQKQPRKPPLARIVARPISSNFSAPGLVKGKAYIWYCGENNRSRKPAIRRSAVPIFRVSGQFCSLLQNKLV